MDVTKIVSICLSSLIIIQLLKKLNADYALYTSLIINLSVTFFSFGILLPVFNYINELSLTTDFENFINILFKSAGICLLCTFAAEICRDSGEGTLAERIELTGKCTLIAYSLPLIKEVFGYAASFAG